MVDKPVVRLFGARASWPVQAVPIIRWLFALLVGLALACTLVLVSGCQALCKVGDQPVVDARGTYYASACR
jgi:hypothetical protein